VSRDPARRWALGLIRAITAALVTAAPSVAVACPQCAGREDGGNAVLIGTLIALMVALPYGVTATVLRLIRRHDRDGEGETSTESEPKPREP
jgi:hypothetical protein